MIKISNKNLCEHCFAEISTEPCPKCGYDRSVYRNDPITLKLGSVLTGRYMIGGVIGKGGFGITYLAYDLKLDARIAVKEYYPMGLALRAPGTTRVSVSNQQSEEPFRNGAEKFYNEAKMVAKFNGNPNIVSVHDFFYENDTVYFTMGYLEGETLKSYIKRSKVTEGQAVKIMQEISNALMAAHSMRILHRDVSPDNIMICDDGTIRLLDFGAARQVMAEQSQSLSVILKQGFAPLEQYQKRGKQGPWTDIYALGATIYNALTGDILDDPMTRLDDDSDFQSNKYGITDGLWNIIRKSMMLKIEDRYQDIFELKKDLNGLAIEQEPIVEVKPELEQHPAAVTAKAFDSMAFEESSADPNATVLLSENPFTEKTGGETVYTGQDAGQSGELYSGPDEVQRGEPVYTGPDEVQSPAPKGISPVIIIAAAAVFLVISGIVIGIFAAGRDKNSTDSVEASAEISAEASAEDETGSEESTDEGKEDGEEDDKAVEPSEEESGGDTENHTVDEGNIDNYEEDEDTDEDVDYKEEDEDVDKDSGSERMLSIAYVDATSELEASSVDKSTYYASNLYDGNYTTAWVDGVEGSAAGQSLTIHLNLIAEFNSATWMLLKMC